MTKTKPKKKHRPDVLTVPQAAAQLGVTARHVLRLLDDGEIMEGATIGRNRMAVAASVAKWERKTAPREKLTVAGRTHTYAAWAAATGLLATTIAWRHKKGWPPAECIRAVENN